MSLRLPKAGNVGLARNTGAGEYMVRIERKGNALTFAVDAQYNKDFKPDVERTIPDIRAIAPWLTADAARLYFGKGGLYESIRTARPRRGQLGRPAARAPAGGFDRIGGRAPFPACPGRSVAL